MHSTDSIVLECYSCILEEICGKSLLPWEIQTYQVHSDAMAMNYINCPIVMRNNELVESSIIP